MVAAFPRLLDRVLTNPIAAPTLHSVALPLPRNGLHARVPPARSPRPNGGGDGSSSDDDAHGPGGLLPNHPLFVGVMARQQLAGLDQSKKRSNASWCVQAMVT